MATTYRQQMVRCGKSGCRRCSDGSGHGPYWYAFWRDENGRSRSRYCGLRKPDEAVPHAAQPLRVQMLGRFAVTGGNIPLDHGDWHRASARQIFALLLLHPNGLARDQICDALWPERPAGSAMRELNSGLSWLRRLVNSGESNAAQVTRLGGRRDVVRLDMLPRDQVDLWTFTAATDVEKLTLAELSDVLALYGGELLPEYRYEDWTAAAREGARRRWHTLSLQMVQRLLDVGDTQGASARLREVVADAPAQEEAARLLMMLLATDGHRDQALLTYKRLSRALMDDLGVEPDDVTQSLARRLQTDAAVTFSGRAASSQLEALRERIDRLRLQPPDLVTASNLARLWSEQANLFARLAESEAALRSVQSGKSAIAGLPLPVELCRLLLAEATVYAMQGQAQAANRAATEAEQLAVQAGERALGASALLIQAQANQQLGQAERAIILATASAERFEAIGAEEYALRGRRVAAYCVWCAGRFAESEGLHRRNLDRTRALGKAEWEGYVLAGLASALFAQGELDQAERCLVEAQRLAVVLGDIHLDVVVHYHWANVWVDRTFLAEGSEAATEARAQATRHFEQQLHLAESQGDPVMMFFGSVDYALLLLDGDDMEIAPPLVDRARQVLTDIPDNSAAQAWMLLLEARLALRQGQPRQAEQLLHRAIPAMREASPVGISAVHRELACAYTVQGQHDLARTQAVQAMNDAIDRGQRIERLRAWRILSTIPSLERVKP